MFFCSDSYTAKQNHSPCLLPDTFYDIIFFYHETKLLMIIIYTHKKGYDKWCKSFKLGHVRSFWKII